MRFPHPKTLGFGRRALQTQMIANLGSGIFLLAYYFVLWQFSWFSRSGMRFCFWCGSHLEKKKVIKQRRSPMALELVLLPLPALNKSPFVFLCAKVINHFTIQGLLTIFLDDSGYHDLHPHPQHQDLSLTCQEPALYSCTVGFPFHTAITSYVFNPSFPLPSPGLRVHRV